MIIINSVYKVYHDGGHYIASRYMPGIKTKRIRSIKDDIDYAVENLYKKGKEELSLEDNNDGKDLTKYVKDILESRGVETSRAEYGIAAYNERTLRNLYNRRKRFFRKAYMNKWNYFTTFTYDDKKQSEESFERGLRKCLSNLHTRRGWCYMGVFERSSKDRLHLHCLMNIPEGQMIEELKVRKDYNKKTGKIKEVNVNTFFEERFGRNDFTALSDDDLRNGNAINYLLKYIDKSGAKAIYSRGIPGEVFLDVKDEDLAASYRDYIVKYVLFDDVMKRK